MISLMRLIGKNIVENKLIGEKIECQDCYRYIEKLWRDKWENGNKQLVNKVPDPVEDIKNCIKLLTENRKNNDLKNKIDESRKDCKCKGKGFLIRLIRSRLI